MDLVTGNWRILTDIRILISLSLFGEEFFYVYLYIPF